MTLSGAVRTTSVGAVSERSAGGLIGAGCAQAHRGHARRIRHTHSRPTHGGGAALTRKIMPRYWLRSARKAPMRLAFVPMSLRPTRDTERMSTRLEPSGRALTRMATSSLKPNQ